MNLGLHHTRNPFNVSHRRYDRAVILGDGLISPIWGGSERDLLIDVRR